MERMRIVKRESSGNGWLTFTRFHLENGTTVLLSDKRDGDWNGTNTMKTTDGRAVRFRGGDFVETDC